MSNVYQLNSEEQRIEQASEWIAKIDRGLLQNEKAEFEHWLDKDKRNLKMLMDMAKMWDKMDALSQLSEIFPHSPAKPHWLTRGKYAVAASLIVVSLLSVGLWKGEAFFGKSIPNQHLVSQNVYTTNVGEHATFYLQDKTKVVLNTDSKVKVSYTDKQRLFELLQGEFHVTVAHNQSLPLNVYAGSKIIQAVGTAFNVELINQQVELIVTDGKVLVADQINSDPLTLKDQRLPTSSLAVSKGQKVELGIVSGQVLGIKQSDIDANLSWQQGNLIFRGESLQQAMNEVSRYTDYQFELVDESLKNIQVAGLFKTGDVDGLLAALQQNFNVRHQRIGSHTIRLKLAKP
jgi:transmembrane sensor